MSDEKLRASAAQESNALPAGHPSGNCPVASTVQSEARPTPGAARTPRNPLVQSFLAGDMDAGGTIAGLERELEGYKEKYLLLSAQHVREIEAAEAEVARLRSRACKCEFSSGGVLKELCQFHSQREVRLREDAERYQELCVNPAGGSHLLMLLDGGKGNQKSLDGMIDRIRASRLTAIEQGIAARRGKA